MMLDDIYEKAISELLDMIRGVGKFEFIGPGITSYPNSDENGKRINAMCLELEKRGLVYRHDENDKAIIWMPTKDFRSQDLADSLQRQAQAEKLAQELIKLLFNRAGLDRLRAIPESEWQAAEREDANQDAD